MGSFVIVRADYIRGKCQNCETVSAKINALKVSLNRIFLRSWDIMGEVPFETKPRL